MLHQQHQTAGTQVLPTSLLSAAAVAEALTILPVQMVDQLVVVPPTARKLLKVQLLQRLRRKEIMAVGKTRVASVVAAVAAQVPQEQMVVRTLVAMVVQGKQTTSRELMSRTPVVAVAVAIATPPELVELVVAETEAVEEMKLQRKASTD
jgi:hypothetical protein